MALLSARALEAIERELVKYPADQKQSAVMSALRIAQEEHGWISNELMEEVAGVLGIAPVAVYEVATFYNMYRLKPAGRHTLSICTNLPCALSGAAEAGEALKHKCGVHHYNETSGDGRYTVREGECFGACGDAPVVLVDNKRLAGKVAAEKVDELLKDLD
jgi:NADH-quinone oxidoreductase subunit E